MSFWEYYGWLEVLKLCKNISNIYVFVLWSVIFIFGVLKIFCDLLIYCDVVFLIEIYLISNNIKKKNENLK